MQLGILGLPKAGKTTLFNALTSSRQQTDKFVASKETNLGVAQVHDDRLARLRDLFNPKKYVPATTQYVDIPGISKGDGKESLDLGELRNVDALVHVVRAFEDPEVIHPDGSVDPSRDLVTLDLELMLADYEIVERRLERLEQAKKRGLTDQEKREQKLLDETIRPALENEKPLRELELEGDDERALRGFQLLSQKPMLVVVNVGEDQIGASTEELGIETGEAVDANVISAAIEEEVAQLDEEDRAEYLEALGLGEPSVVRLVRASYELLGLIAFFTVGEDEVRAWTIRQGTTAKRAAGAVHSDIERGFIRAEVVGWEELLDLGSLAACRDQGKLRLEGKEYLVEDGEVVHYRFNV